MPIEERLELLVRDGETSSVTQRRGSIIGVLSIEEQHLEDLEHIEIISPCGKTVHHFGSYLPTHRSKLLYVIIHIFLPIRP
jgi:hypothetical protein